MEFFASGLPQDVGPSHNQVMTNSLSRRKWIGLSGAGVLAGALPRNLWTQGGGLAEGAVAIASGNGLRTVEDAYQRVTQAEERPVHAAVMGVRIQEDDPRDMSVGYGGLPNERGVVQLDSACMDGPTHNAGGVACIENIKNPAQVAEIVMDQTDHVLLVGEGATEFGLSYGFKKEDLLTPQTREVWLRWRARRSNSDDWLAPLQEQPGVEIGPDQRPYGTIHCSVLNGSGDLGCCTTTSGLAYKIPGRVGDSPLIGCGLYCDNEVGSAGATGRGEAAIHSGGSWLIVERMRMGDEPQAACLYALQRVAEQAQRQAAWQPSLWKDGRPGFNLQFYAVRKDGLYGSARMLGREGAKNFAVCDSKGPRKEAAAILFPNN